MLTGIYYTDAIDILKNLNILPQLIEINYKKVLSRSQQPRTKWVTSKRIDMALSHGSQRN